MRNAKKISIIVAVISVAAGLMISFCALAAVGFDLSKLVTVKYETNTYLVSEDFKNITMEVAASDIYLLRSEDERCRVICTDDEKVSYNVTVEKNTLKIVRVDHRRWYEHIGFGWEEMQIEVYLPQSTYESLYLKSVSGDIEVSESLSFFDAEVKSTSGDIRYLASTENDLTIRTVSGDLYAGNVTARSIDVQSTSGDVKVASVVAEDRVYTKTTSGDIELSNIKCGDMTVDTTSGSIELSDVITSYNIRVESTSGDIDLNRCDAESLWLKSISGDVFASLLTEKMVRTDTVSGDVEVPMLTSGGKCEVKTTSGDIKIFIRSN